LKIIAYLRHFVNENKKRMLLAFFLYVNCIFYDRGSCSIVLLFGTLLDEYLISKSSGAAVAADWP
jgi:hypothetical protein